MLNNRQLRFPFACLLLVAALLRGDPLAEGIAHWEAGRHEQAAKVLKKAFRDDPNSSDACTYLGLATASMGDHEMAIVMFQNALLIDPTLGRARLELAQSYFALGLFASAEEEFRTVWADGAADGKVRENIEGFLQAIDEKRAKRDRVFLQNYVIRLELARDSNARVSPTGSVYFDVEIPGLDGALEVPIERDGYLAFWAAANYEYRLRNSKLAWQARVDAGNVAYADQKDLDIQVLGARIGPALRLADNGAAGIMLRGLYMDKDYEDYLRGWGGLVWTAWRLPHHATVRAEAELMQRDFTQSDDDGSDGTYGHVRLVPAILLGDNLVSGLLSYGFANTDNADESYDRLAAALRLRRPLLRRWKLHGEVFASVRKTLYDSPGVYSPSRRRDTEYALGTSIERVFTTSWLSVETWRVGLFYEYTKSLSNLDLYDYDRHLTGLRATVVF